MYLNKSFGRKRFKENLGNANHLIITSLVGLDAIEREVITDIPKEMRMAWSPKSPKNSARRSRRLILDMSLIRAVDAIDLYIRDAMREPYLIQDGPLRRNIDSAGRSVFKKLDALNANLENISPLLFALTSVLVSWRNEGAHVESDDTITDAQRTIITDNSAAISERFSALDVQMLLRDYDDESPPTFKEVASLINVAHHYIENLEEQLFSNLDRDLFLRDLVRSSTYELAGGTRKPQDGRSKISEIWGRDQSERKRYVRSFLQHRGLSNERAGKGPSLEISEETLNDLEAMSPGDLKKWLAR